MNPLRIGTRTSKLALAQATLVKNALQIENRDLSIEIIGIETKADTSDTPIPQLEDNAFCIELDQALLDGQIDCAVHALKDRSLPRPTGIISAAITKRDNPRDVVIFRHDIIDRLQGEHPITVGVSSERRTFNTIEFLTKALPYCRSDVKTTFIRGAIEKRLRRLNMDCDGIVLAVAGINRLFHDPELHTLLHDKRFMLLPLSEGPSAPGQGALAIDCRSEDTETKMLLDGLHDIKTVEHVEREYAAVINHRDAGATSITSKHFPEYILFLKGSDTKSVTWPDTIEPIKGNYWDGTDKRREISETTYLPVTAKSMTSDAIFVAHSRAAAPMLIDALKDKLVWTSGPQSWFRLAQKGVWVQGCTEELGHEILRDTIDTVPFLNLPKFNDWQVLTHDQSNEWQQGQTLMTYTVKNTFNAIAAEDLLRAEHVFWSSASQYELYKNYAANDCRHYCRAGKTADALKNYNLDSLTVFPNSEMWRQCLTKSS